MPKMLITKGLPGCGKTEAIREFLVRNRTYVNICKNDLRNMQFGSYSNYKYTEKNESYIKQLEIDLVQSAISAKKNIVISDTNLNFLEIKAWERIAKDNDYHFDVMDFFDVFKKGREYIHPYFAIRDFVKECKVRNLDNVRSVPESIIDSLATAHYYKPNSLPFTHNKSFEDCVIVDVDGTLAHMDGRFEFDLTRVETDKPDHNVIDMIRAEKFYHLKTIIVMSGRSESCMVETAKWLEKHCIPYDYLFMRGLKDNRPDDEVKYELYMKYIHGKFNAVRVYDDRNKVVHMWRHLLNLKVMQVQEGDF